MKRLLVIAMLALFVLAGGEVGARAADPGACQPEVAFDTGLEAQLGLDNATPAAHAEKPRITPRSRYDAGPLYACNSRCANSCRRRFAGCNSWQCGRQYQACIRGCGC